MVNKRDLKIKKVNIKMEESLNSLIKSIDSHTQKDTMELIRTKINKGIDELRKNDKYFRRIEREEVDFWYNVLCEHEKSDLYNLFNIYRGLKSLINENNYLKDILNKD